MADYRTETVVTPDIPASDMTPLERLMLSLVFDEEAWSDGTFFSTWNSPNEWISPREDELCVALEDSPGSESRFNEYIANLLAAFDAKDEAERGFYIEIDLTTSQGGWPEILQDIVRRSNTIEEIVVWAAFTCSKMCADGFGGSVMRITGTAIQYSSTTDMLEQMSNEQPTQPVPESPGIDTGGHETRSRLEGIAATAGWDSFTLLLQISRWLDRDRHTEALAAYLDSLACDETD